MVPQFSPSGLVPQAFARSASNYFAGRLIILEIENTSKKYPRERDCRFRGRLVILGSILMNRCLRHCYHLLLVWAAGWLLLVAGLAIAHGAENNRPAEALRPFYLIGHGANTLSAAREYLEAGANGLEVDVNTLAGHTNMLCIGHGPNVGTGAAERHHSVPLADYFQGLHELARSHPRFCLVYFDCKTLTATPECGQALLDAIRTYLTGSGADRIDLNVLISVGKLKQKAMFTKIAGQLGPHEGLMVDGYSDPAAVSAFFAESRVTNQAFCDGIVPLNPFMGQFEVYGSVRHACRMRDEQQGFRFVGTWVVNNPWLLARYMRMGVDGIVVDRRLAWYNFCWANWGNGLRSLTRLVSEQGIKLGVRPANREDNPFAGVESVEKKSPEALAR
jgi:glycerophosphoryl diester phosphodiesterase